MSRASAPVGGDVRHVLSWPCTGTANPVAATLCAMRRWFSILLLVLLPTQMSWAAVAAYCAHETGAAVDHVGHHDHADHAHGASPTGPAGIPDLDMDADSGAEADCGHCHGQCTGMLLAVEHPTLTRLSAALALAIQLPCAAHAAAQPERPQWAPLA